MGYTTVCASSQKNLHVCMYVCVCVCVGVMLVHIYVYAGFAYSTVELRRGTTH